MPIIRLVEYGRRCDAPDCLEGYTNVADWHTRAEAETAAINDGWIRLTYNRWMCPACKRRAEAAAAKEQLCHE
jgi:hypothetical protein